MASHNWEYDTTMLPVDFYDKNRDYYDQLYMQDHVGHSVEDDDKVLSHYFTAICETMKSLYTMFLDEVTELI